MLNNNLMHLNQKDYVDSYNELAEYCIRNTNLYLMGEFGDPSCPSISDLDVLICLKSDNYKKDKDKILRFINSNSIYKYLFFHDPLIIPDKILPYLSKLHTIYNLKLTYNPNGFEILRESKEYVTFLDLMWTCNIMVTGLGFAMNNNSSLRDKLLVYKNICQSLQNLDNNSLALSSSNELRKLALEGKLSEDQLNNHMFYQLNEIYKNIGNVTLDFQFAKFNRKKYRIRKDIRIILGEQNKYEVKGKNRLIVLEKNLFGLFTQLYLKKSDNYLISDYINYALKVHKINNFKNKEFPFIVPFIFRFYEVDFKTQLRKVIYRVWN